MQTKKSLITLLVGSILVNGCGGGGSNGGTNPNSKIFYLDTNTYSSTYASLQRTIPNITTKYGNKTLNVWVSNDSFDNGNGCQKSRCVTQEMVDELADTFLKAGSDNDIYDWVTNIYGEEWDRQAHDDNPNIFIPRRDEIDILLTDIDNNDNPNSGAVGYFYAKDNFLKEQYSGSNERIMFYIDSVMFANTDNGDFWQKEVYSTLAHEFQHMINFYQKNILLNAPSSTWLNELVSETTEDAVATKINHTGPRGVDPLDGTAGGPGNQKGRYPVFNEYNDISITTWESNVANYGNVNAFGAFLTRNYGVKILHDIIYNTYKDKDAIGYAVYQSDQDIEPTKIVMEDSTTKNIDITQDYQVENIVPAYDTSISINIPTNTSKNLYLIITNYGSTSASTSITHSNKVIEPQRKISTKSNLKYHIKPTPEYIQQFNNKQYLKSNNYDKALRVSSSVDYDGIFNTVLREWGIAVMLSDIINPSNLPTYNTGGFIYDDYNNITYNLGSINFFNYIPQPTIHTSIKEVNPTSNYYYLIGKNLTGTIDVSIKLEDNTQITLIAK